MDTQLQPPALAGLTSIPPLSNPVIISDLHLAPKKPKTIMGFVRFMRTFAPRYAELVILGDAATLGRHAFYRKLLEHIRERC